MAARVLLVHLGAEARGPAGPLLQRALQLTAQAEQAASPGKADVDDAALRVGQLIDARAAPAAP